ncbi:MAG: Mov34/MPN/PAD-1 family protein [Planctomycetes bacterium]|nr:Mov34/MPN/PAD-1 family protein [Planctomycetota bacterium]
MTVYRTKPLPQAPAVGHLVVPDAVREATLAALCASGRSTPYGARADEGLVYWAGRVVEHTTLVTCAILPDSDHEPLRVVADEKAIGACARAARQRRLGLIAQVHSHPGRDTRHSDGDDDLVLMPFEGMFSLVVASYGASGLDHDTIGVHQFRSGRWWSVTNLREAVIFVPSILEVR